MKRFPWIYYLFFRSRVDFSELAVRDAMRRFREEGAVAALTGMSAAELDELGGFSSRSLDAVADVTARTGGYDGDPF